jgi:hypothetical protein
MKKILLKNTTLALIAFLFCANNLFAQYSNSTLNGAWFLHTVPLVAMEDSVNYLIFDGAGSIIDGSMHGTVTGTYDVTSSGVLSGQLIADGEAFPIGGQFSSQNEVNMESGKLTRVSNPGALTDTLTGVLITNGYGQRSIILQLNSQGQIISSSGLTDPVSGRVYANSGVFIGKIKTGEPSNAHWNEFIFYGYCYNDSLIGEVVVDATKDSLRKGPARLKRSGVITPVGVITIEANSYDILIYPNPASDFVTLNIDNVNNTDLILNIYNVTGTLVKSEILKQDKRQINIGYLRNGIYVIEIKSKEWTKKQKLIIQR